MKRERNNGLKSSRLIQTIYCYNGKSAKGESFVTIRGRMMNTAITISTSMIHYKTNNFAIHLAYELEFNTISDTLLRVK